MNEEISKTEAVKKEHWDTMNSRFLDEEKDGALKNHMYTTIEGCIYFSTTGHPSIVYDLKDSCWDYEGNRYCAIFERFIDWYDAKSNINIADKMKAKEVQNVTTDHKSSESSTDTGTRKS